MTHDCAYPHVPECSHLLTGAFYFNIDQPEGDPCDDSLCGHCTMLRACEERVLNKVIERAELTFRSDVINPVRDVIEPLLDRNDSSNIALTVGDIRKQAYRDGYNDAMRVQSEVEWLYGPRRPVANPKRVGNMNTPTFQTTALDGPTGTE